MKLLTLLTTLIITLASSNVFARTFVCENWGDKFEGEIQGTMFSGEKKDETFIIRDFLKAEAILTHIGRDGLFTYYTSSSKKSYIQIFGIEENAVKHSKDGKIKLGSYDFRIANIWVYGVKNDTFCNYQVKPTCENAYDC